MQTKNILFGSTTSESLLKMCCVPAPSAVSLSTVITDTSKMSITTTMTKYDSLELFLNCDRWPSRRDRLKLLSVGLVCLLF